MSLPIDSAQTGRLLYNNAVQHEAAGILVRSKLFAIGQRLGFNEHKREHMALVAAELVTNQIKYAQGRGMIQIWEQPGPTLDILALDYGPGIKNLSLAQQDGYSSKQTLGKGLGSVQRLADEAHIYTRPGDGAAQGKPWTGTAVLARFRSGKAAKPGDEVGIFARALTDERFNGDHIYLRHRPAGPRWLHLDGLGHGQNAQETTSNLMGCMDDAMQAATVLQAVDERLHGSRGAVAILAEVNRKAGKLVLHGVGDMQAYVIQEEQLHRFSFSPGVLGKEFKLPTPVQVDLAKGAVIVTVSDGIRRSWDENSFPGLFRQNAQLIAYVLGNIMGRISDDQSLCAVRLS
ncbi:MAG: SpoIIE family protein phosphatase [Betaproteobacteria bacterium]|nr:SpoIIE family protein phosphatase [Betaproteobacteria bacterium]